MLLAAPKKRPELRLSLQSLLKALKNIQNDMKLRFILMKGCKCEVKELNIFYKILKKRFPSIKVEWFSLKSDESKRDYNQLFHYDMYHAISHEHFRADWRTPGKLKKHYLINHFFIEMAKHAYHNLKSDLFIFLEDDIQYDPLFFKKIISTYPNRKF
ncbi:Uncharacterized protein QTN25_005027 [Entamoeba marina]